MTVKSFCTAVVLLVAISSALAPPAVSQPESGGTVTTAPSGTRAPRPGPNFPALESYYPEQEKRAYREGTVVIHYCVDTDGRLTQPPTVATSSGMEDFDNAALNLANAGNGLYLPGTINGVPQTICSQFKVKFELREDPVLTLAMAGDPRVPRISGRLRALSAEYGRRMLEVEKTVDIPRPLKVAPDDPASVQTLRQFARALDSALDQSVGLSADMLDDMEYLGKNPDIPEQERAIFLAAWPAERISLAQKFSQMTGATRDVVRAMDELADYLGLNMPRHNPDGTTAALTPLQDQQLEEIRERALSALARMQRSFGSLSKEGAAVAGRGK